MTLRVAVMAGLVACGTSPEASTDGPIGDPPAEPPPPAEAWGDHGVGTETDTVDARGGEELPLQVWFPSDDTDLAKASYDGALTADAQVGATPACETPRPVLMFSHGSGGTRYQSVSFTEHLASHGYVVAAPDHVGNTTFDIYSVSIADMGLRRPADIADSFDHLVARSDDPNDPLAGCIDGDAGYAIAGHSFGGWTTLAAAGSPIDLEGLTDLCNRSIDFLCGLEESWAAAFPGDDSGDLSDDRVWAAIPMAPVGLGSLGPQLAAIDVPTLVIGGRDDTLTRWDSEVKPIYQSLEVEPRGLAGLYDAGHYHFTDFCIAGLFPGCGDDSLDPDQAHLYVNGLALSWLRLARGEDGTDGWLPPDDEGLSWKDKGVSDGR